MAGKIKGEKKGEMLVVGSGKMARDLGLFFLEKGYGVTWLSSDADRLSDLEQVIEKKKRQRERILGEEAGSGHFRFGEIGDTRGISPDIVLETGP